MFRVTNLFRCASLTQKLTMMLVGASGHLDTMTQQNATLADQSATTARTLTGQAQKLADIMPVFRIEGGALLAEVAPRHTPVAEPRRAACRPAAPHPAAPRPAAKPAVADRPAPRQRQVVGSDWPEF